MLTTILLAFLVIFGIVAVTIVIGLKFYEGRQKKKVTEILKTSGGTQAQVETRILVESEGRPGLEKLLARFNFARTIEENIQQAGMNISLNTLLIQMIVLLAVGALVGARMRPLISPGVSAVAVGLVCALLPYLIVRHKRKKRLAAFEEQFAEALDFLARAMRAGHAFTISLEMLSEESPQPLGQEFRKVFNEHNLGLPIETALDNLTKRVPLLDVKFFVSAVLLQRETGGNLSEILTKLAHVIRERFKLKGQVAAASAHGRITGTILTLMPVALALGLLVVAPGYLQTMFNDPDGKYIILAVCIGQLLGHYCIKRIVKIKV